MEGVKTTTNNREPYTGSRSNEENVGMPALAGLSFFREPFLVDNPLYHAWNRPFRGLRRTLQRPDRDYFVVAASSAAVIPTTSRRSRCPEVRRRVLDGVFIAKHVGAGFDMNYRETLAMAFAKVSKKRNNLTTIKLAAKTARLCFFFFNVLSLFLYVFSSGSVFVKLS